MVLDEKRIGYMRAYLNKLNLEDNLTNYYRGKNILVTGGAGAIGSNLIIALSDLIGEAGKVVIIDNLSSIKQMVTWNIVPLRNVLFVKGDIRNDVDLKRVFKENIDIVFHLAAFFANQNSVDYPEVSVDVDINGLVKTLEYSRLGGVQKFVYASSGCAIYGSYPELPLKEDFISMHLTSPYQINKMTGEMYCNYYNHQYNLKTVNCRFFNSYGPGEVPGQYRNVIPNFIYWAMKQKALTITGTGQETRDFTNVQDLVQGLVKGGYCDAAVGENFNLASGVETMIVDLAKTINSLTGNPQEIKYINRRKWDTKPRLMASIAKAKNLINYEPIISFDEGLLTTIEWFRENWDQIEILADFNPGMSSALR